MTEIKYVPPDQREKPDPQRRPYFEEYMERRVFMLQRQGSGKVIEFDEYVTLRQQGRWNDFCDEHLRGRGKVE